MRPHAPESNAHAGVGGSYLRDEADADASTDGRVRLLQACPVRGVAEAQASPGDVADAYASTDGRVSLCRLALSEELQKLTLVLLLLLLRAVMFPQGS